jgi:cardiolipin synthase
MPAGSVYPVLFEYIGYIMSRPAAASSSGFTLHNRVRLIRGGRGYFSDLLDLIASARHSIHFQTYIYSLDETGEMVAQALEQAADRGVVIYMMADGYASQSLSGEFAERMFRAGIRFRLFEPILKSRNYYFGRRLHQKVVVADATVGLVAGVNISNRYNDMPGQPAWLDWAIRVEGEAAGDLQKACAELWSRSALRRRKVLDQSVMARFQTEWACPVRVRRNDWVQRLNQVSSSYVGMFNQAQDHILIMSSYFLPGRVIRNSMARAAKRGVKVSLILAGKSDVPVSKQAERYFYRWLLVRGITIHEYPGNVLHGKLAVSDGEFVTGGSYNVNNISAYASIELNLDVVDKAFGVEVEEALRNIRDRECIRITEEGYRTAYGWWSRVLQQASYEFVRMMFFIFTFYFRQQR